MADPFDRVIERVHALLLIHTLKESEGGWKLSMEMIVILAIAFEDAILPGGDAAVGEDQMRSITGFSAKHAKKSDA